MVNKKLSKKTLTQLGVAAAVIVLVLIIGFNLRGTGEVVNIGVTPFQGMVDLTTEESVVFTVLPTERRFVHIKTALSPFGTKYVHDDFSLVIEPMDEDGDVYEFTISLYDPVAREDRLDAGGSPVFTAKGVLDIIGDSSRVYLRNNADPDSLDNIVDLVLELDAGVITVTNRHYLSSTNYDIVLYDNNTDHTGPRDIYGPIIRLNSSAVFGAIVNITGIEILKPDTVISILPEEYNASISLIEWDIITDYPESKNSTINMTWLGSDAPVAALLNVSLHVDDRLVNKYYRLSVENLTYNFSFSNMPMMNVTFEEDHESASKDAELGVVFRATTALQPFFPPCVLESGELLELLNHPDVEIIYWYDDATQEAKIAISGGPRDIFPTDAFSGFFVKLKSAQRTRVNLDCEMKSLTPAVQRSTIQFGTQQSLPVISKGWNLFGLPGALSKSLTDFGVNPEKVKIYECSGGGEICPLIPDDKPLVPGKVYWIDSLERFTGSSVFS